MRNVPSLLAAAVMAWTASSSGTTAVVFGLSAPMLLGTVGLALDYSKWNGTQTRLQTVADQAALAAARELKLGSTNANVISQVAQNYVLASLPGEANLPTITATVPSDLSSVTVDLVENVSTVLAQPLGLAKASVHVKSRARITNGPPLCLLTLDPSVASDLQVSLGSNITATGCAAYSNSTSSTGVAVLDSSVLKTASTCSGGGYTGNTANFSTMPMVDCPAFPDPLASRPAPTVSSTCDFNNTVIVGGARTITPGVYCGGLNITAGANVTASPGIYIIKDGLLTMTLGSSLTGSGVGFYLTGANTYLLFGPSTTINLSAPISGAMAGILFWEDKSASKNLVHAILSQHAHNLLGTLYFPKGKLTIGSPNAVADQSFYTIIVARQLQLAASPNLVLNSNYTASVVPVPQGLGSTGLGAISLEY